MNGLSRALQLRHWPHSARTLAWLALVIVLALLPHLRHLPPWIPLFFVTATGWRLWIEVSAASLPPRWLRNLLALLLMALVVGNFRTLNGLEAGTALLSVMAGMKLLESRAQRDYTVVIFIAFFLLFAELLYEQTLMMLPYLLGCTLLSVSVLLQLHVSDRALTARQALGRAGRMLLQALPLTVLLFLLVPRLPGQFWVLPARGAASSGLSDEMSPGDVSNLTLSDEVAFRVQFQDAAPPNNKLYWRAIVLHDFDGRTWRRRRGALFGQQGIETLAPPYRYRMLLEPSNQPYIPALDVPLQSDLRRSYIGSDRQLASFMPVTQLTAVNVVSAADYRLDKQLPDTLRRIDTALPGALNPRARTLAQQWRNEAGDDAVYMRRLLQWFHTQSFYYTLEPPSLGVNAIDEFLFTTQKGFCEHYASALTFMLRAVHIPARVVTGYQGGEFNPISGYWVIRQADAHAWVEAWLPEQGWVRVDPTMAIAAERIERGLVVPTETGVQQTNEIKVANRGWLPGVQQRWDALNTFWKERIVNFDPEEQRAVLQRLGIANADWRALGLLLGAAFIAFFLGLMVYLGWQYRPARLAPETEVWRALLRKLEKQGVHHAPHEGPVDFLNRAAQLKPGIAGLLLKVRDAYVALRYAPDPAPQLLSHLKHLVNQLPVR